MIIVPNNTDAPLHHHYDLLIQKPCPSWTIGSKGAFCCRLVVVVRVRGDLEQHEVKARVMEQLRGGDGEGEASAGQRCCGVRS